MSCCGITCTKRKIYIPYILNRIPKQILCRMCHKVSRAIIVVDSYNLEFCMCQFILYTSPYYLICVLCEGRIKSFNELQCTECYESENKYCRGCGNMRGIFCTKAGVE